MEGVTLPWIVLVGEEESVVMFIAIEVGGVVDAAAVVQ